MSKYNFSQFLSSHVINKVPASKLAVGLQLNYEEFSKLDNVTLSRWCNGKTTPSFYRQLLIASYAKKVDKLLESKISKPYFKKKDKYLEDYLAQMDHAYHSLTKPNRDLNIHYRYLPNKKCRRYYKNSLKIEAVKEVSSYLDKNGISLDVNIFYIGNKNEAYSYFYYFDNQKILYDYYISKGINKLAKIDCSKILWSGIGYYSDSLHFRTLIGLSLNHIIEKYIDRDILVFAARGRTSILFFENAGAEKLATNNQNLDLGQICLYQIEFNKLMKMEGVPDLIKEFHPIYTEQFNQMSKEGIKLDILTE